MAKIMEIAIDMAENSVGKGDFFSPFSECIQSLSSRGIVW